MKELSITSLEGLEGGYFVLTFLIESGKLLWLIVCALLRKLLGGEDIELEPTASSLEILFLNAFQEVILTIIHTLLWKKEMKSTKLGLTFSSEISDEVVLS